jgi:hypothetical protein
MKPRRKTGWWIPTSALAVCAAAAFTFAASGCRSTNRSSSRNASEIFADTQELTDPAEDPGLYPAAGNRHFLMKVLDEGTVLILEDGSVWGIDAENQPNSVLWKANQEVAVIDMGASPNYRIVNRTTREQVTAEYRGTPQ